MQRYTITIVSHGIPGERPILLVPFQPQAVVTAFVDELWKRVARQNIPLTPNTHIATLHIDSENGAIIDVEDVLSDVVPDPKNERLFAVFNKKPTMLQDATPDLVTPSSMLSETSDEKDSLSIRIITPADAMNQDARPLLRVSKSATISQLHKFVAESLNSAAKMDDCGNSRECNCTLANKLADGPSIPDQFLVVHGKSIVERVQFSDRTEVALEAALRDRFGGNLEATKKTARLGGEIDVMNPGSYKKTPVVSICSKERHTPAHARVDIDETGMTRCKILDLHTSESPIHPTCAESTLEDAGLEALAVDGVVDIYAINRTSAGNSSPSVVGKSSIFRARAHWEPIVGQSDRGMAMFLSSLRIFASLVQDMQDDGRAQDAALHSFDLLTKFPPALRTLHILCQGNTPTAVESAAMSHAVFEALDFVPTAIIGTDRGRVFEGARLFFGFVLEKARTLKLPDKEGTKTPYLSAFQSVNLLDFRTNEAVAQAVQTSNGLVESALFDAFAPGAVLAESHIQSFMIRTEDDPTIKRQALFNGGIRAEIIVFSAHTLASNYRYRDAGDVNMAIDLDELSQLSHLAELCGRNKLAVHKPSQLASAVAPCLTFDRKAHLAVYTGQAGCVAPGHSAELFRPLHGQEAIDPAVVEQLIAPILQSYEADGSAVFDAFGGAAVKKLQAPDEIVMFCVDCSASMRQATDFDEVNDDHAVSQDIIDAQSYVATELYAHSSFEDTKERLCACEGFDDMIAIVEGAAADARRCVASQVLSILRTILSPQIIKQSKDLEDKRQYSRRWTYARREVTDLDASLQKAKELWAGLKTHEEPLCDFLIYRATSDSRDIAQRWFWTLGDAAPTGSSSQIRQLPKLEDDITDLPHYVRCPISHTLLDDAVTATDGHTYSHSAINKWFDIRTSSPMTGLQLDDKSLVANQEISDAAARWADGDGIPERSGGESKRLRSCHDLEVHFNSRVGTFTGKVSSAMSLRDLYKLAFRGLKGKFLVFQLSTDRYDALAPCPSANVSSKGIDNGAHINIRIADDDPATTGSTGNAMPRSDDSVLVKVYQNDDKMEFGFWVSKSAGDTMALVIWKYWRHRFRNGDHCYPREKQVWVDLEHSGDNLLTGKPLPTTERLAPYLTRRHCSGKLDAEKVYRERDAMSNNLLGQHMVLKVQINEPWMDEGPNRGLSRLDVLKQMFEALINRMLAYNFKSHLGLITFDTTPHLVQNITHVIENLRRATAKMHAKGDTALWDALALARDQLEEYGKQYPEAKQRIICISDGVDTKSTSNSAQELCWRLRHANIALDSVGLGNESNRDLRTMSYLLGCYRFRPAGLVNALAMCEMEPFLSITERPAIMPPPGAPHHRLQFMGHFWNARYLAKTTVVSSHHIPPRKEHPNLRDGFIELSAATSRPGSNPGSSNRSNRRIARLMNEMTAIVGNGPHPKYDIYVSETDMSFWKILMDGPDGTPYEDGTFLLYIDIGDNYPWFAPKARFITKIKHPNVNMHGRICHSIFDRDWTSDTRMGTVLDTIFGLLYQPEHSDPVNTTNTLSFHHDEVEFADEVREHVDRYASRDRESWRKILLGEVEESDEDDSAEDFDEDDEESDGYDSAEDLNDHENDEDDNLC